MQATNRSKSWSVHFDQIQIKFPFFSLDSYVYVLISGDLLYYGGVEWLNISDFLGKIKKGLELHAMCFVFKSAVVFLCKERLRQKKKLMVREKRLIIWDRKMRAKLIEMTYDNYDNPTILKDFVRILRTFDDSDFEDSA